MSTWLSFEDIVSLGEPQVTHLEDIGNAFPDAQAPGACEAFSKEVRRLESFLTQTYALAVSINRKTDDVSEVGRVWERMSDFCTIVLHSLLKLKHKYPYCGTPELHDLTLDYKLACEKRYHNALEELQCQKTTLPTDLFPEKI